MLGAFVTNNPMAQNDDNSVAVSGRTSKLGAIFGDLRDQ